MLSGKSTLAIYGIQDIDSKPYPVYVHDHNLTLMSRGKIVKHLQLERITRLKYDHRLPQYLLNLLRKEQLISENDIDVVFVDNRMGRSFINREGNIRFEAPLTRNLSSGPEEGRLFWLDKHVKGYVVNHELAHVFSNLPFYGPFKDNSLHVHFDGGASQSNFSAWHFLDGEMKLLEYHWDMKRLSSLFNANALTFYIVGAGKKDQNGMPGKFMGYSSFGQYRPKVEEWLAANDYFGNIWGKKSLFFRKLKDDWNIEIKDFDLHHTFIQDIATTIQFIFERELLLKMKTLKEYTKADTLYYSGGSALNIKANSRILNENIFEELYIPPCTNDTGLSVGAAAFIEWMKYGEIRSHTPYLNNWSLNLPETIISDKILKRTAELIMQGETIGVCNGSGEAGPRALGNRSIIARADSKELATHVSLKLKGREWYRPVAPIMTGRNLSYFTGVKTIPKLSKYMLMDFDILPERINEIEGCVHVDGTSRIQVIEKREENPFMFELLNHLDKNYGMRALINTSFNGKGKPIVHSLEDAVKEGISMGLDYLVLNGSLKNVNDL